MPELTHTVTPAEAGRTVKSIALKEMKLSRGMFSSLKFAGGLTVNGEPVRADYRLNPGDALSAKWQDGPGEKPAAWDVPFDIPWQDDHYWIIHKPAPLPTLSSAHQAGPTLENALYTRLGCPEGYLFRPVNRLDKGTSGLMAVARDAHAQQLLQRQLHSDTFIREYKALCIGSLPASQGVIDLPIISREGETRRTVGEGGREAETHYQVEWAQNGLSLVRLRLKTGRTHQIRVHLSALGCPIVGDYLYGSPCEGLPGRFALHAWLLQFSHPFTGETVRIEAPLPDSIMALMQKPAP